MLYIAVTLARVAVRHAVLHIVPGRRVILQVQIAADYLLARSACNGLEVGNRVEHQRLALGERRLRVRREMRDACEVIADGVGAGECPMLVDVRVRVLGGVYASPRVDPLILVVRHAAQDDDRGQTC